MVTVIVLTAIFFVWFLVGVSIDTSRGGMLDRSTNTKRKLIGSFIIGGPFMLFVIGMVAFVDLCASLTKTKPLNKLEKWMGE